MFMFSKNLNLFGRFHKQDDPIQTPKYNNPAYEDSQEQTPEFVEPTSAVVLTPERGYICDYIRFLF